VARLGGEEFVVALPRADLPEARALAEKLRRAIGGRPMHLPNGGVSRRHPLDRARHRRPARLAGHRGGPLRVARQQALFTPETHVADEVTVGQNGSLSPF
jgi:Response regulator containing a CheY-like receiver domain and a GGDEF domain